MSPGFKTEYQSPCPKIVYFLKFLVYAEGKNKVQPVVNNRFASYLCVIQDSHIRDIVGLCKREKIYIYYLCFQSSTDIKKEYWAFWHPAEGAAGIPQ